MPRKYQVGYSGAREGQGGFNEAGADAPEIPRLDTFERADTHVLQ